MRTKGRRQSTNVEDASTPKGKAIAEAKTELFTRFLDRKRRWDNHPSLKKGIRILKKTPIVRQSAPDGLTKKANESAQKERVKTPAASGSKVMNTSLDSKPTSFVKDKKKKK